MCQTSDFPQECHQAGPVDVFYLQATPALGLQVLVRFPQRARGQVGPLVGALRQIQVPAASPVLLVGDYASRSYWLNK